MANDDRKQMPRGVPVHGPEPIKVRQLRASGPGISLPHPARNSTLVAGERSTGEVVTIQYEPWQRHHRVRELEGGKVKTEVCIPESWVAYTPES